MQAMIYQGSGFEIEIRIDAVISLDKVFEYGGFAMRDVDKEHIARLVETKLEGVPAIQVANTNKGYVLIDGRHRYEAARQLKKQTVRAIEGTYASEDEIIEAAFQANLKHGIPLDSEGRANYVLWLYGTTKISQTEISKRVGISQQAVSKIIKKFEREEKPRQASPAYEAKPFVQKCLAAVESLPYDEKRSYEQDCTLFARMIKEYVATLDREKKKDAEAYLGQVADVLRYAGYV